MKEKYLVILAVMVIGTAIAVGFVFWSNRNLPAQTLAKKQKAENPCFGLSADPGEISCEEAKETALKVYPGKVMEIAVRDVGYQPNKSSESRGTIFQTWSIRIRLTNLLLPGTLIPTLPPSGPNEEKSQSPSPIYKFSSEEIEVFVGKDKDIILGIKVL